MENSKTLTRIIAGLVVLLIAGNVFLYLKVERMQKTILDAQLAQNVETRKKFEESVQARRDCVITINRTIDNMNKQRRTDETLVRNTRGADSLIALYYRFRTDLGP